MSKEYLKNKTLKGPLYGNCRVQDPNGVHIFNCGDKKANWYVKRSLAEIVQKEPFTIRLSFTPNGKGHANDDFYLQERQNICVCCGRTDHLTKHHVVPYCYRKFFPDDIKNHSAYDILPVCYECHEKYEERANEFKKELAKEYNVAKSYSTVVDPELKNVCLYATALLHHSDSIPSERAEKLMNVIRKYYKRDNISTQDLEVAATLLYNTRREGYKAEGLSVVEKITNIEDFIKRWRQHFITTMQPTHMPKYWVVERPMERARINKV